MKPLHVIRMVCLMLLSAPVCGQSSLQVGQPAPDFNLTGVDGKRYSLNSFREATVLVVIFTCNHCPTAQAYEERFKKFTRDYAAKGVAVVAVSSNDPLAIRLDELGYTDLDDTYEAMKIRAREHEFNFPYLYDGKTQETGRAYGAQATPHVFVLDNKRAIRYQGRFDNTEKPTAIPGTNDVIDAVEALLAGKPVAVAQTKTFGCSMKFSDKQVTVAREKESWKQETVNLEKIDEKGIAALLKNDSDKLRLINVWATWCGPCVSEFPDFLTMYRMYRGRDFELVTISADPPEKEEKVLQFLQKRYASNTNYLFDQEDKYKLIEAVDPNWQGALPYTLLIAPGGKIVYAQQGTIEPLQLRKIIVESSYIGRYY